MRTLAIGFFAAVCWLVFGCLQASAFDLPGSRSWSTGGALPLSDPSASTVVRMPWLADSPGHLKVELLFGRQYEIPEFTEGGLATSLSFGHAALSFGAAQFGDPNLYSETTFRWGGGVWHGRFGAGGCLSYRRIEFGQSDAVAIEAVDALSLDLGAAARMGRLSLSGLAANINRPRLSEHSSAVEPRYTLFAELVGLSVFSLTARLTAEDHQRPQFGLGQMVTPSRDLRLLWGLSTNPIRFGGGMELRWRELVIGYDADYHLDLGLSQMVSLAYRLQIR